jgi:uncharacterized membrane protein
MCTRPIANPLMRFVKRATALATIPVVLAAVLHNYAPLPQLLHHAPDQIRALCYQELIRL